MAGQGGYIGASFGLTPEKGQPSQPSIISAAAPGSGPTKSRTTAGSEALGLMGVVAPEKDPFQLLTEDHRIIEQLIQKWRDASGATAAGATAAGGAGSAAPSSATASAGPLDADSRKALALELVRAIVSHASVEEQHVHALYRSKLPGATGDVFFRDSLAADQANKDALARLERCDFASPEGLREGTAAVADVARTEADHFPAEETVYWPALRQRMSTRELEDLHASLLRSKAWAPMHSHPSAPDKPLLARLTHPVAGALDWAHDALFARFGKA